MAEPSEPWDDFVSGHEHGTLFHDSRWARIVAGAAAHQPAHLVAEDASGIRAVLPLFEVRSRLIGKALISSPYAVYGGILARDAAAREAIVLHLRQLVAQGRYQYAELRQYGIEVPELPRSSLYVTFVRDLPEDPEACLEMIPRKSRATARQARDRHQLTIVEGWHLFDAFYELFVANKRSLGSPCFARSYFVNFFDLFPDEVVVHGVKQRGEVIATVMSFIWGDTLCAYYSGSRPEAEAVGAMNFLYWKLMEYSVQRGLKKFDFGRSRVDTGAYRFKINMGFAATPLPYAYALGLRTELPSLNPGNPKFQKAEQLFSRLPVPIVKWVGPKLMRHLP